MTNFCTTVIDHSITMSNQWLSACSVKNSDETERAGDSKNKRCIVQFLSVQTYSFRSHSDII